MDLMIQTPGNWLAAWNATAVGDVTIAEQASLWFGAVIRGDVAPVVIGRRTNVQDNAVVHCDSGVPNHIGESVTIGHGAIVHGRSVGNGSLIGMNATVLSRSVIGIECLIAAGAVVPPDMIVPDRMVVMGVPGKIIRPVKPEELEYMRWLTGHYIEVGQSYIAGKFNSVIPRPAE
jgi:carbonic anhydrase/acetyltransferase-like protein (isoleucine patch superfamily)